MRMRYQPRLDGPVTPRPTLILVGAALAFPATADDRFERFLEANPPRPDLVCAYTSTATSSEYPDETRVERLSHDGLWRLLSVNGEPPSEEALADYADEADERDEQRRPASEWDFAEMVGRDTVRVVEEDAETLVFARAAAAPASQERIFDIDRDFPAWDPGPWPEGFVANREQLYDDFACLAGAVRNASEDGR